MLELTPDNVPDYLRSRGLVGPEPARAIALGWGVSNIVLRIETPAGPFIVKQSRPQLRTRDPWFSDLRRVYREQEVMEALYPLLPEPTVPKILDSDRDNYVFAMSHAPADARVWKELLLAGKLDQAVAARAGFILGRIHEATARDASFQRFAERTVFEQLRIEPYYVRIQERRPEVAAAVESLITRMRRADLALCHGDYSPKNILVHGQGFTLVDYETAHFGDPTMDLGFFLSHLVLKAIRQPALCERFFELTRVFWKAYSGEVHFAPIAELERLGSGHFGVCVLARIDGTSPVEYLPEESKRETARRIGRRALLDELPDWESVLRICEQEIGDRRARGNL